VRFRRLACAIDKSLEIKYLDIKLMWRVGIGHVDVGTPAAQPPERREGAGPVRPSLTARPAAKPRECSSLSRMSRRNFKGVGPMPAKETSGVHIWLVLWKSAEAVRHYAEESIQSLGVCRSDFGVLEALLHKGPLPVNEIGRRVLLTSGSITTAIDRLEAKGLVQRRADDTDRRARIVHLTKLGRRMIEKTFADHAAHMERLAGVLQNHERDVLLRLLRKLGRGAAAIPDQEL
jgi:MarR family 2-MHQ and catechol resistance regulon transcriptional repressor